MNTFSGSDWCTLSFVDNVIECLNSKWNQVKKTEITAAGGRNTKFEELDSKVSELLSQVRQLSDSVVGLELQVILISNKLTSMEEECLKNHKDLMDETKSEPAREIEEIAKIHMQYETLLP